MRKIDKMNLEELCELRDKVLAEINKRQPTFEDLITMGVALEYIIGETPESLRKEYEKKLSALQKIYSSNPSISK